MWNKIYNFLILFICYVIMGLCISGLFGIGIYAICTGISFMPYISIGKAIITGCGIYAFILGFKFMIEV